MAIYRTGQASMDAQGYITGYETKWREQLTLIRPGATIFFIDAPFQAAVISEVISDTQIRAITTGGAEIGRSNYIILLHDSITVDGLAQDVAETLRYYQSKETQIEEAIEFFKNFDLKQLQDLANQVKGDAEKTANDRAATEQLKSDTQQIKDSAVTETNKIKADTDAIKSQTQQIKDSAVTETEAIKQEAFSARDQAELARDSAGNHATDANNAKAGAETARDEARQWAQQVNPENLLHKDQNLKDLADKVAARKELQVQAVISNDPTSHSTPEDYNSFTNPQASYELRIANNGEWRVARNSDNTTSALSVVAGGTGACTTEDARINLRVNRLVQNNGETVLYSPDQYAYLNIPSLGNWGVYDATSGNPLPLGVMQGGTGASNEEGARESLGLGNAATKNVGETTEDVMQPGMFGIGRPDGAFRFNETTIDAILDNMAGYGLSILRNDKQIPEPWYVHNYSPALFMRAGDTYTLWCAPFENNGHIRVFGGADGRGWLTGRRILDDVTTTVDSNGFIKKASPIVKVYGDGYFETNDESKGVTVTKIDTGVYHLKGMMGLHSDASWGGIDGGFEIPLDRNKQPRIWIDYEVNKDGSIVIKTFHRSHPNSPSFANNFIGYKDEVTGEFIETVKNGDPVDIPEHCFVSVRVQMPI